MAAVALQCDTNSMHVMLSLFNAWYTMSALLFNCKLEEVKVVVVKLTLCVNQTTCYYSLLQEVSVVVVVVVV